VAKRRLVLACQGVLWLLAAGHRLPAALHSIGVQAQAQWQFALQKRTRIPVSSTIFIAS
jgi:hypothetical protein